MLTKKNFLPQICPGAPTSPSYAANYRTVISIPCLQNITKSLETMQVTLNYKNECQQESTSINKVFGIRRLLCNRYPEINSFGFEVLPRFKNDDRCDNFSSKTSSCFCFKRNQFQKCASTICKRKITRNRRQSRNFGFSSEKKSLRNPITFDFRKN